MWHPVVCSLLRGSQYENADLEMWRKDVLVEYFLVRNETKVGNFTVLCYFYLFEFVYRYFQPRCMIRAVEDELYF
jgi:hypothetical protein